MTRKYIYDNFLRAILTYFRRRNKYPRFPLWKYNDVMKGTVEKWIGNEFKIIFKCDAKPYHGKSYRIYNAYIFTVKN